MTRDSPGTPPYGGSNSSTSGATRGMRLRKLLQDVLTHYDAGVDRPESRPADPYA